MYKRVFLYVILGSLHATLRDGKAFSKNKALEFDQRGLEQRVFYVNSVLTIRFIFYQSEK